MFVTARASRSSRPGASSSRRRGLTCSPRFPRPPVAEVELQRRVAARAENGLPRGDGERRPPEVRVEKDPRGVDDGPRAGGRAGREGGPGRVEDRACGVPSGAEAPRRSRSAASRRASRVRRRPWPAASASPLSSERSVSIEGGMFAGVAKTRRI